MPADLYNGLTLTLLRNTAAGTGDVTVQTGVFTPTLRLVKTVLHREGEGESITIAGEAMPVQRYLMTLELGA
jgi:hypothetical protein